LDVIKSKAQSLMIENNNLQGAYQQYIAEKEKLQQAVDAQQYRNEQMSRYLEKQHGRTDQEVRMDELLQGIKVKRGQVHEYSQQMGNLQWKKSEIDRKLQQLKYTISDIEIHQQTLKQEAQPIVQTQAPVDDQLAQLRKQLEGQNKQEVILENEWNVLKNGGQSQHLNADAIDEENKQLEAKLNVLQLEKIRYERRSADTQLVQASSRMYEKLKKQKDQLEENINAYEMRLEQLRESTLTALSWPLKKKKLIHEMVQDDAHNNQIRDKIKVLQEDIGILKDQVAKLERRVDFVQGKQIIP